MYSHFSRFSRSSGNPDSNVATLHLVRNFGQWLGLLIKILDLHLASDLKITHYTELTDVL